MDQHETSTPMRDEDGLLKSPFVFAEMSKSMSDSLLAPQMAVWAEWLRFVARRLEAQAALIQDVSRCTDVPGAVDRHTAFVNAAATDYAHEASTLMSEARKGMAQPRV